MDREFLDLYNRELLFLHEQARDFAEEYPGIAERLGGLLSERMDPMIGGLLEGAAFLAARVQLKLKHEFPEFTSNLLEQLIPNYLAPTPSAMLVKVLPPYGDSKLRDSYTIRRGAYLDATYRERDRQIACRYRLRGDIALWPFDITGAEYYTTPAPLQALGLSVNRDVLAGCRISFTHRMSARIEDEVPEDESRKKPETWASGVRISELPIYLLGTEADAILFYEQIISDCIGVHFRYFDDFGDPVIVPAPRDCIRQVGFGDEEALFPNDNRIFRGFDFLREYFMFPRKFLAFKLINLNQVMPKLRMKSFDVLITFNEVTVRLAAAVQPSLFSLYTAPAINLFEKTTDRIPVKSNQHEYHVVPDRSRTLDFEPHRILDVYAHFPGGHNKVPVPPLYSASMDKRTGTAEQNMFYTVRRLPRRRTAEERLYGMSSDYTGTDMFLSLSRKAGSRARTPSTSSAYVRFAPTGISPSNCRSARAVPISACLTTYRSISCASRDRRGRASRLFRNCAAKNETAHLGTVTWRLVNMLSMNHLGLVERGAGRNAAALREVLTMFADLADSATERKIRGIRNVDSRPVVRRIKERSGIGAGRGIEVTVMIDEKAFEGIGAFLLGAILDRFFCEYAALNHFTETVIHTTERGEIMRWPARMGSRRSL